MILEHYLQLLSYYRKLVVTIIVGVTLATVVLSVVLLVAIPVYRATAKVSVLPTDSELTFTRTWLQSSQYSPASMMTQTHIEYLLSRPVAQRTIDRLMAELGTDRTGRSFGPKAMVRKAFGLFKRTVRMTYNLLNSGKHVSLDPYEDAIGTLMDGTRVRMVEGSFILEISVRWDDPKIAAAATNMLAEAYVDRVREQVAASAKAITNYLDGEIQDRQARLDELRKQELETRQSLGVLDVSQERQALLDAREAERSKLKDDEAEIAAADERTASLRSERAEFERRGLNTEVEQELAFAEPTRRALERRIEFRKQTIDGLTTSLAQLAQNEDVLLDIQRDIAQIETEITDLRDRMVTVDLSQSSALSNLRIIDPARVPLYPSAPKVVVNTFMGLMVSVILAAFALIALDTTTNTVKTSADLFRPFGERGLGWISRQTVTPARMGRLASLPRRERLGLWNAITRKMRAFEHDSKSPITVISLTNDRTSVEAGALIAGLLAGEGLQVRLETDKALLAHLRLPDRFKMFAVSEIDAPCSTTFQKRVICIGGFRGSADWTRIQSTDPFLVFVVEAGAIEEVELEAIRRQALDRGFGNVFGILLAAN